MKKSRFTEEQIIKALHEWEAGAKPGELCRRLGGAAGGSDFDPIGTVLSFIPLVGTFYSAVQAYQACF